MLFRSNKTCIVFDRDGLAAGAAKFDCDMASVISSDIQSLKNNDISNADDGKLRSYRLALCVNGEYSVAALNGAGGTDAQKKAIVLSVLTINLTRANAIYERDFGIHMNFAANETNVIYLDAATDPFGSGSSGWNNQTQATCDGQIGNSNYDVGHFIAKVSNAGGNNGSAGCIGCVCKSSTKGRGFTAHVDVVGDQLVVDY